MDAKSVFTPYGNIYIQCRTEEHLYDTLAEFESFLQEQHLRLFVKIGRLDLVKMSFDFSFGEIDEEDRQKVVEFLSPSSRMETPSKYRITVNNGHSLRHYPTNDLNLAIILCKVLNKETDANVEVELYEYDHKEKHGEWKIWQDRSGKACKNMRIKVINGQMTVINLA